MKDLQLTAVTKPIVAKLKLAGSKSIANRVLLLAAVANGVSIIHNIPDDSEDVILMLNVLKSLGVKIEKITIDIDANNKVATNTSSFKIHGNSGNFKVTDIELFCGNSGTMMRFLTPMLAFMPANYVLTGVARMKERPIGDLVEALLQFGAKIDYLGKSGYPPLHTKPFNIGNNHNNITTHKEIFISGKTSSQYLTGLLMAITQLKRPITLIIYDELISKPYIDITIGLLAKFGVNIEVDSANNRYTFNGIDSLKAIKYTIEPDASTASYFLAMGALKGQVRVMNLTNSSLQGDKNFALVLRSMGAVVNYFEDSIEVSVGKLPLKAININMENMPDVAMTIAVLALFADGETLIRGIQSWKFKETNRLKAMKLELSRVGANVTVYNNGNTSSIRIKPPKSIKNNIAINTYNDHRMAMSFSLLAIAGIHVIVKDYECVAKTFANYFNLFTKITLAD